MAKRLTQTEFIEKVKKRHNNLYDYSKTKYYCNRTRVIITCKIHGDFEQKATGHLQGKGCNKCAIEYKNRLNTMTIENFIEKSNKIHNNKYDYSQFIYKQSRIKGIIICPIHGKFEQTPSIHLSGHSCKKCNLKHSQGEKLIESLLQKYNIEYIPQKTFPQCKNKKLLPFDFYLPQYNICIEFDGKQHYIMNSNWFGGEKQFYITKNCDKIKTEYCSNNNLNLIRISYKEYNDIENILIEKIPIDISKLPIEYRCKQMRDQTR